MLTFVFGAGASNDAIADVTIANNCTQPPLTDHLFDVRSDWIRGEMSDFPEASGLFDHLRRRTQRADASSIPTIEAELRVIRDSSDGDPQLQIGLMAIRHYLQRLLWRAGDAVLDDAANMTNYTTLVYLVERIRARSPMRVDFITFNYDFLLERALEYARLWSFDSIESYVQPSGAVFKPHGSVDWGRLVTGADSETFSGTDWRAIDRIAPRLSMGKTVVKVPSPGLTFFDDHTLIPAIAIPVERKSEFETPETQVDEMWKRLADTRMLILIGWKAGEEDFVSKLSRTLRSDCHIEVLTKSEGGAAGVEARLRSAGFKNPIGTSSGGFTRWLEGPRLNDLLAQAEQISRENPEYAKLGAT